MEYIALILLFIGAISLFVELFVPGFGFFGALGIILLIASATITLIFIPLGPLILLAELVVLFILGYLIVEYVKRNGFKGKIVMDETLDMDENNEEQLRSLLGKEGVAKTPLKPCGNIQIGGEFVEAYSDGDFIMAQDKIIAVRVSDNKLYVRKTQ